MFDFKLQWTASHLLFIVASHERHDNTRLVASLVTIDSVDLNVAQYAVEISLLVQLLQSPADHFQTGADRLR